MSAIGAAAGPLLWWTPELDRQLIEMREANLPARVIAQRLGVRIPQATSRVRRLARAGKCTLKRAGPKAAGTGWFERCAHIVEPELNTGCWLWPRRTDGCGYGVYGVGGRKVRGGHDVYVHRASYTAHFGPFPVELKVCHKCDTPACSNPNHLFLGTQLDNMRDRDRKGRGFHKLTYDQVDEIRRRAANGERGIDILPDYPIVSPSLVYAILAGNRRTLESLKRSTPADRVPA